MRSVSLCYSTVVLPEYQGFGIGPRLSDAIGQLWLENYQIYTCTTSHPRLGGYRSRPGTLWDPDKRSGVLNTDSLNDSTRRMEARKREDEDEMEKFGGWEFREMEKYDSWKMCTMGYVVQLTL